MINPYGKISKQFRGQSNQSVFDKYTCLSNQITTVSTTRGREEIIEHFFFNGYTLIDANSTPFNSQNFLYKI
jgi:hypothetical protein